MVLKKNNFLRHYRFGLLLFVVNFVIPCLISSMGCAFGQSGSGVTVLQSFKLSDEVTETSGLIYYNNLIWTFNDSGGDPELYGYSEKDSAIVKRITLWNGYNFDWEDITQDSSFIYIGDIGNNFGNRGNLCIYRIGKKHLTFHGNQAVKADKIFYTYPNYKPSSYFTFIRSAFDCEAMIYCNDSIYLFSKDWVTDHCMVYSLPSIPGNYMAHKICEFDSKGLITAADYDGKQLILLGYNKYNPFLLIYKPFSNFHLDKQIGRRIELHVFKGAQTEGLAIKDANTIYISNEKCSLPQGLFKVRIN